MISKFCKYFINLLLSSTFIKNKTVMVNFSLPQVTVMASPIDIDASMSTVAALIPTFLVSSNLLHYPNVLMVLSGFLLANTG